jgi:hypothetical protein
LKLVEDSNEHTIEAIVRQVAYLPQNTRLVFDNIFPENYAVYEIMWKNIVEGAGHRWQYGA